MNKQPAARLSERSVEQLMDPVAWEVRVADARKRRLAALEARRSQEHAKDVPQDVAPNPVVEEAKARITRKTPPHERLHVSSRIRGGSDDANAVIERAAMVAKAMAEAAEKEPATTRKQTTRKISIPMPGPFPLAKFGAMFPKSAKAAPARAEQSGPRPTRLQVSPAGFWMMFATGATAGIAAALWIADTGTSGIAGDPVTAALSSEEPAVTEATSEPVLVAALETTPVVFSDATGSTTPFDAAMTSLTPDVQPKPLLPRTEPLSLAVPAPQPLPDQEVIEAAAAPAEVTPSTTAIPAPPSGTKIRVHIPDGGSSIDGEALVASLTEAGYDAIGPIETSFTIDTTNARFFHEADGAVANSLIGALTGQVDPSAVSRDFTHLEARPSQGTLELWLSGKSQDVAAAAVDAARLQALVRSANAE